MSYTAAVITMSDKGSQGLRKDTSGPAVCEMLKENGWDVVYTNIIPDDFETIKKELMKCADELDVCLIMTTGGTGFSKRDVTPEATHAVADREVTQIGKECHQGCAIRELAGDCVMPREGIFIKVLQEGTVKAGDEIEVI